MNSNESSSQAYSLIFKAKSCNNKEGRSIFSLKKDLNYDGLNPL